MVDRRPSSPLPGQGGDRDAIGPGCNVADAPLGGRPLLSTSTTRPRQAASNVPSFSMPASTARDVGTSARRYRGGAASRDVQDEVGLRHLLQRRAECFDQFGRQFADEPDGIGQDHAAAGGKAKLPHRRVQGREQLVLRVHVPRRSGR